MQRGRRGRRVGAPHRHAQIGLQDVNIVFGWDGWCVSFGDRRAKIQASLPLWSASCGTLAVNKGMGGSLAGPSLTLIYPHHPHQLSTSSHFPFSIFHHDERSVFPAARRLSRVSGYVVLRCVDGLFVRDPKGACRPPLALPTGRLGRAAVRHVKPHRPGEALRRRLPQRAVLVAGVLCADESQQSYQSQSR